MSSSLFCTLSYNLRLCTQVHRARGCGGEAYMSPRNTYSTIAPQGSMPSTPGISKYLRFGCTRRERAVANGSFLAWQRRHRTIQLEHKIFSRTDDDQIQKQYDDPDATCFVSIPCNVQVEKFSPAGCMMGSIYTTSELKSFMKHLIYTVLQYCGIIRRHQAYKLYFSSTVVSVRPISILNSFDYG